MAQSKNQGEGTSQTGYIAPYGHLSGYKPQRPVAIIPGIGNANGNDQRLAQGSRASVCQKAVGSHSLPGYGPVISVNRPVRTRGRNPGEFQLYTTASLHPSASITFLTVSNFGAPPGDHVL